MPTQTVNVPPELLMTHNGVHVYHTYKDDDVGQGRSGHYYTLYPREGEEEHFDVRLLDLTVSWGDHEAAKRAIAEALDDGRLPAPKDVEDNLPYAHCVLVEVCGLAPDFDAAELVEHALYMAADQARESRNPSALLRQIGEVEFDVTAL